MNGPSGGDQAATLKPSETVLIVEDEIVLRYAIADYLRECGFKVIEAANADEALIVLQRRDIAVQILFSDIVMPGSMNGFALAQWVRKNRPEIKCILAGTIAKAADAAGDLCEDGPLPKPYESQAVVDRIRRLLGSKGA